MAKRKAVKAAAAADGAVAEEEAKPVKTLAVKAPVFKNKEKVLLLTTRGVPYRFRHLVMDLVQLVPHCKKDSKLDTKSDRAVINEVAEMKGCSSTLFFEVRKHQDLYMWVAKTPDGPTVKFHVTNIHTMAELKLTGNHLKGSRPVLSFDAAFDEAPHLQLLKEMFTHVFSTPKRHPKSKPFFDHVLSFTVADDRIFFRNYQVVATPDKKKVTEDSMSLVEVGPRFCMQPIKVFANSFGGATIYENPDYVSPNVVRAELKRQQSGKYKAKIETRDRAKKHKAENQAPRDLLSHEEIFKK